MLISLEATCSAGAYEKYEVFKTYIIPAETEQTIFIKYIDLAGNESNCISKEVKHSSNISTAKYLTIPHGLPYFSDLPSNNFPDVYVDSNGVIYVGTSGGLSAFNKY